jgi:hypothetical protein
MPMQQIESIDEPRRAAAATGQLELFEQQNPKQDDFRNRLIWGDNKLVMASLLQEFKGILHETILSRSDCKLVAQLDFSATPKDNKGLLFKQIVCDTPLGEAVDAGIVKTPLIGQASRKLVEQADDSPPEISKKRGSFGRKLRAS